MEEAPGTVLRAAGRGRDAPEKAKERLAGVGVTGPAPGILDEVTNPGRGDRLEQFFLGREMPVHRPGADPGRGGDLVEGDTVAGLGEGIPCRPQHL
jgi:hypothetical protein